MVSLAGKPPLPVRAADLGAALHNVRGPAIGIIVVGILNLLTPVLLLLLVPMFAMSRVEMSPGASTDPDV